MHNETSLYNTDKNIAEMKKNKDGNPNIQKGMFKINTYTKNVKNKDK